MQPLEILTQLPSSDGIPLAAHALELVPLSTSIVEAVRDEDGAIIDFCVEYSNLAASGGAPDRTSAYGKRLFEILPAFQEAGLRDKFASVVETGQTYSQDNVHLTGTYEGVDFDVVLEVVAISLGGDRVLSVSHDRTEQHSTTSRLSSVQAALTRKARMEEQISAVNDGLIEDLVNIQRALDDDDVALARRHAATGAQRAAEVVSALRNVVRADR